MTMSSTIMTSSNAQQQPPTYILQSWRYDEQINLHDRYLLQQTFIIAPDTCIPYSRLRQHIRDIYKERAQSVIIVHNDPWKKITQDQTIVNQQKNL